MATTGFTSWNSSEDRMPSIHLGFLSALGNLCIKNIRKLYQQRTNCKLQTLFTALNPFTVRKLGPGRLRRSFNLLRISKLSKDPLKMRSTSSEQGLARTSVDPAKKCNKRLKTPIATKRKSTIFQA